MKMVYGICGIMLEHISHSGNVIGIKISGGKENEKTKNGCKY